MSWEQSLHLLRLRKEPHVVYVARDSHGDALYVGCTHDLPARLRAHRSNRSLWIDEAETVDAHRYPNFYAARYAERLAIQTLRPSYNVAPPTESATSDGAHPMALVQNIAAQTDSFTLRSRLTPGGCLKWDRSAS
jgi:predicted GIY-YIG superfamily endonuclease